MKLSDRLMPILVVGVIVLGAGTMVMRWVSSGDTADADAVIVPNLSDVAARGNTAYDRNCASCHGVNAAGSRNGPPLVHGIYNPGHHADNAFYFAAKRGVRRHHWQFGDMPPQPQVTDEEIAAIVRYVRELQEANGIYYKLHTM